MSDCSSSSSIPYSPPKKYRCPVNGKEYSGVSTATIMHHIKEPWKWHNTQQAYYFCEDPECDVVYFGQDDSFIKKYSLRTAVWVKEKSGTSLICYCFGVDTNTATTNQSVKDFVIKKISENACACKTRNPSGKCCLKDFPRSGGH